MSKPTGIWISQKVLDRGLSPANTMVLAMITEMQKPNFHTSNGYIAKRLNINIRSVERIVRKLHTLGLINISGNTSSRIITLNKVLATTDKTAVVEKSNFRQNDGSTIDKLSDTTDNLSITTDKLSDKIIDIKKNKLYMTPLQKGKEFPKAA